MDRVWWWGCGKPVSPWWVHGGMWWWRNIVVYVNIYILFIIYIYVVFPSPSPKSFQHWSKTVQNHQKSKGNYPKKQPFNSEDFSMFSGKATGKWSNLQMAWGWISPGRSQMVGPVFWRAFETVPWCPKLGDGGVLLEKLPDFWWFGSITNSFPLVHWMLWIWKKESTCFVTAFRQITDNPSDSYCIDIPHHPKSFIPASS